MFLKKIGVLLSVASLLYAAAVIAIFPKWAVDDAYITFRYAENLALHGELNWNAGEIPPVEGYTGVALPAILAGFIKMGISPVVASRGIGIFSFFLSWVLLFLILRRLKINEFVGRLTLALFSTTPVLFTHATSGLETMLFMSAILLGIYAFLMSLGDANRPHSHWKPFFLFLVLLFISLIRPEGVAFSGFIIVAAIYVIYRYHRRELPMFLMYFALFYLLPSIIYLFWKVNYYGVVLPNTFYVKATSGFYVGNFLDLARFVRRFFAAPILMGLMLLAIEADWLWGKFKNKSLALHPRLEVVAVSVLAFAFILVAVLMRSHLTMNYSGRFYVPLLPIFWIGLATFLHIGLFALPEHFREKPIRHYLVMAIFFAISVYQIIFNVAKLKEELIFVNAQKQLQEQMHNKIGEFLGEKLLAGEWIVAYMDAGAVPYFSKLKSIDFGALNDIALARGGLSPSERIDYFFAKNPGAVVFTSMSAEKLDYGDEAEKIIMDPRFKNYALFQKYLSPTPIIDFHEFVYLRKDIYSKLK